MVKLRPKWCNRVEAMEVGDRIIIESLAITQHLILANLRKMNGKFRTRRVRKPNPEVGFWVERVE